MCLCVVYRVCVYNVWCVCVCVCVVLQRVAFAHDACVHDATVHTHNAKRNSPHHAKHNASIYVSVMPVL